MWIKTTGGEAINTDYLSELHITAGLSKSGDEEYWTAGWMPNGRKESQLVQGPFPTKGKPHPG